MVGVTIIVREEDAREIGVDPTITSEQLKAAVCKAAEDESFKDELCSYLENKKLTTGRPDLDAELLRIVEQ